MPRTCGSPGRKPGFGQRRCGNPRTAVWPRVRSCLAAAGFVLSAGACTGESVSPEPEVVSPGPATVAQEHPRPSPGQQAQPPSQPLPRPSTVFASPPLSASHPPSSPPGPPPGPFGSPGPSGPSAPLSPSPTTASALAVPDITVSLDEQRLNIGQGVISILVTNNTDDPLPITAAALATPRFDGTSNWVPGASGSSTLRPGATVALPATLAAANCSEMPDSALSPNIERPDTAIVLLTFNGLQHEFEATDPHFALARIQQQDCLERAMLAVASVVPMPTLSVAADGSTAVVHLSVVPTGASADMMLANFGNTTLLAESPQQPWPRNISVSGTDPPTTVDLAVKPARCDPHALAEDKAGTKVPVTVAAGQRSGELRLEPSEEFTRSVYGFVASACGN